VKVDDYCDSSTCTLTCVNSIGYVRDCVFATDCT
jgi:hypothetical protein